MGITAAAVGSVLLLTPLKETKPYVLMVNTETGATQRAVSVDGMQISEEMAVKQANVVRYVIDRETYDTYDNQDRIQRILELSDGRSRDSLRSYWSDPENNVNHPDKTYGQNVRVLVSVTGIVPVNDNVFQVFITRTRKERGLPDVENRSTATVGFNFDPTVVQSVEDVWDNPLGFQVTDYRLDLQTSGI